MSLSEPMPRRTYIEIARDALGKNGAAAVMDVADSDPMNVHYRYRDRDVPLAQLQSDAGTYQRDIRQQHVRNIVKNWNPLLMEPPIVNVRATGGLWLVDGQHRVKALLEIFGPSARWRCRVYEGLTPQEEALLFNMQDARVRLRPRERFRAALLAGQPLAVEVNDIAEKTGWLIDHSGNHRGSGTLFAIESIVNIRRTNGAQALERVLRVLMRGFGPESNPKSVVVRGVHQLLALYKNDIDERRLERVMREFGILGLENEARTLARSLGYPLPEAIVRVLWRAYNKGVRSTTRLQPIEVQRMTTPVRGRRGGAWQDEEGEEETNP